MKRIKLILLAMLLQPFLAKAAPVEANQVVELPLVSAKTYANPFMDAQLDAVVTQPDGKQLRVPGFWAGGTAWRFRYASDKIGKHTWQVECSDTANAGLHGLMGKIEVVASKSTNPLFLHGPIRVAADHPHYFEHADGTPFFWLGDTWWKCLAKRLPWEGFQELAADRKAKGFNAVQIVCGPYPDEGFLEPRMANEGGLPYESVKFERVNPEYFNFTDRRIQHLVASGLAPVIVGSWGRGDCNSMEAIGLDGLKRHWRYLTARYAAYPIFWILAGEIPEETKWGQGPWAPLASYVWSIDPYHRLLTCHTAHGRRGAPGDSPVIDFDMVGGNHDERVAVTPENVAIVSTAYAKAPPMPVLVGETCYEGHMQQGFGDVQRHMFWTRILSGAAGHTYGAAGIWHASVEGDPGCASAAFGGKKVYDFTTWKEGMNYPGSTQLGLAKKLLVKYPWSKFEPHPEWAPGCSAAGIPGGTRIIYRPRKGIYDWSGFTVNYLEAGMPYATFFFDPATGRRFDQGIVTTKSTSWKTPDVPSSQDWVLVMQALKRADPVVRPDVAVGKICAGQLAPAGATFAKVAGPDWLTVKPDGSYTGTPDEFDSGAGSWRVSATTGGGETTFIQLQIKVLGTSLFVENFSSYSGTQNSTQYQSGLRIAYNGSAAAWTNTGAGTMHAVDRGGPSNAQNWAAMIFQDNVITSGTIAANTSGQTYRVAFETSPAVYGGSNVDQATQAGDALRIEVLRGNGTVLATHTREPGAWAGTMVFTVDGFEYTGDGSGDVRLRIGPAGALTSGRFQGAIDNIIVEKASAP
jgi:hypothetical protein